jgi:hypothetical protein
VAWRGRFTRLAGKPVWVAVTDHYRRTVTRCPSRPASLRSAPRRAARGALVSLVVQGGWSGAAHRRDRCSTDKNERTRQFSAWVCRHSPSGGSTSVDVPLGASGRRWAAPKAGKVSSAVYDGIVFPRLGRARPSTRRAVSRSGLHLYCGCSDLDTYPPRSILMTLSHHLMEYFSHCGNAKWQDSSGYLKSVRSA